MRDLAVRALDAAARRGVTYADVRAEHARERHISTKNGRPANVNSHDTEGVGIRVLVDGCWGFAATDNLTTAGLEAAATLAIDIARSGTLARKNGVVLAPEDAYQATWVSPCKIDPFGISVQQVLQDLIAVDSEL